MINQHFLRLPGDYLFSEIARQAAEFSEANPEVRLIRMGIGDVTLPLPAAVTVAMERAAKELGTAEGFRGYGPEQGYGFLREAITEHEYRARGVEIHPDEIFISDGAKSDCGNVGDLFDPNCIAAVCDPVYPAYVDGAAMVGRAGEYDRETGRWSRLRYLSCTETGGFVPEVPREKAADPIWLCFPNNPTGSAANREQLKAWVDHANAFGAVLLFDGAYEAFTTQAHIPHSIYEIEGAKTCAIELRSFSKTAGFTGTRCGYTVIPKELRRDGVSLHALWSRRQAARFNGVSYVVQRGAEAVYTAEGQRQVRENLAYYRCNADLIREELTAAGLTVFGGINAPYLWVRTPEGESSWSFFHRLLHKAHVITTPGAGFGPGGEGYIRISAFGDANEVREGTARIAEAL